MSSNMAALAKESDDFVRKYYDAPLGRIGIVLRYVRSTRSWKWLDWIRQEFREDYAVHKAVQSAMDSITKEENKGKVLVFDSLTKYRILERNQLAGLDLENAHDQFSVLEAFFRIHDLEGKLCSSLLPYTEIADELDKIIDEFRKGTDCTNVIETVGKLSRKIDRKRWEMLVSSFSAVIAFLVSVYWLIASPEEQTSFLFTVGEIGIVLLFGYFVLNYSILWHSFRPLLPRIEHIVTAED